VIPGTTSKKYVSSNPGAVLATPAASAHLGLASRSLSDQVVELEARFLKGD
jgi:hypothetical protein